MYSQTGDGACLTYGGYAEANTGLAACSGWWATGIGGQRWTQIDEKDIDHDDGSTTAGFAVVGNPYKLLAVYSCGTAPRTAVWTCSQDGADCGPAGPGCKPAFAWTLVGVRGAGRFKLQTRDKTSTPLCIVTVDTPKPAPPTPPSPPPPPPVRTIDPPPAGNRSHCVRRLL